MGYKIDNNTTCDTTQCAAYSHLKLRDAGYKSSGNAWDSKAKVIYNGWANTTGSDYNTHGVAAAKDFYQNFDSTTLDPEVTYEVNMYYKNSPMAKEAYPDTDGNGLRGTHTGNLYWDPDLKKWIVEHNVHGTIYRDEWFNLQKKGARGSLYGITGLLQPRKKILGIFDTGGEMNYINYYKSGSKIHIKKENKGKFTDYCGGKVTDECIQKGKHSASAAVRKRATFAANARKWKHEDGGILKAAWGDSVVRSTAKERMKNFSKRPDILNEIETPFKKDQSTSTSSTTQSDVTWDNLNSEFDSLTQQTTPVTATSTNTETKVDNRPRGYRNNNPLNLRLTNISWDGKVKNNTDGSFELFTDIDHGFGAGLINMQTQIDKKGKNTLRTLIASWAPDSDGNNSLSYAQHVSDATGIGLDDAIDSLNKDQMTKIAHAMARIENGVDADMNNVIAGWDLVYDKLKRNRDRSLFSRI